jgi:hypothetical protein
LKDLYYPQGLLNDIMARPIGKQSQCFCPKKLNSIHNLRPGLSHYMVPVESKMP